MAALLALSFASIVPVSYASDSYSVVYYLSDTVFSAPSARCHGFLLPTNSSLFAMIYPDFCSSYNCPSIAVTSMWATIYSANGTIGNVSPSHLRLLLPTRTDAFLQPGVLQLAAHPIALLLGTRLSALNHWPSFLLAILSGY